MEEKKELLIFVNTYLNMKIGKNIMIEDIGKRCPHCRHRFSFDFIICPHCGKKYNKKY